jgi:hypothetical protein
VPKKQPFSLADEGVSHLLRHHPSIWSALYRVSYLAEKDIRFVEYPGSGWADNEFFYETLLNASSVVYLDEPFYVYREETPEEFQAFAHREKMLRFDRWQAMADIIDRLGITAPSILASHVAKGFTYLGEEIAAWGESDPDIVRGMQDMFARMEACFVKSEALVPPHLKRLYFAWKGEKIPGNAKLSYGLALVGELVYTAKNNGKDYAFNQIKHVLKG